MGVPKNPQKNSKKNPTDAIARSESGNEASSYEFGAFRLDEKERLLTRSGKAVPLRPKVFDILLLLIRNRGSLVSKDTLLNEIWPDAFVEESNLSVNIGILRKALHESGTRRYIETIPKCGYRFVATVRKRKAEKGQITAPRRNFTSVAQPQAKALRHSAELNSVAVIPFQNESKDINAEYLSDGLTESIINNLSRLSALRVVARNTVFRYKSTTVSPEDIARDLGISSIVSGRVLQLGDRVIIRAELVDVANGWQLWGEQFHGTLSDVLTVQEKISEEISKALEFQLTREERKRLTKRDTDNSEAYHLYLKGRYQWNKYSQTGLRSAIDYFEQAIEIDPTYALAYAGLADCYYRLSNLYAPTHEAMPKAKAAAIRALEIDPNLSEGHAALGMTKLSYEWDWSGAEEEFRQAIQANPNYSIAHQRLGLYFNLLGRFEEARHELELAREMDPLSPQLHGSFVASFFLARDFSTALAEVQKTLEMDSNHAPTFYLLGRIYEELGQLDRAIAVFKRLLALGHVPMYRAALGRAYALNHKHREAREVLSELEEQSAQRYISAYSKATIHLALGDKNKCVACLEKACEDRCELVTWLKVDPALDDIRTDLRFTNLLRRVGLDRESRPRQAVATG
jgi:TolB-like protein/Flp pilus assembly protein TadD